MKITGDKMNLFGMIGFIIFIIGLTVLSGFIFFNNSSNLEVNIRSNDEQIKREEAVKEALTKSLVDKNETIKTLEVSLGKALKSKDSITKSKNYEIKKLKASKDSLNVLVNKYKWSDLEPVNRPK